MDASWFFSGCTIAKDAILLPFVEITVSSLMHVIRWLLSSQITGTPTLPLLMQYLSRFYLAFSVVSTIIALLADGMGPGAVEGVTFPHRECMRYQSQDQIE